MERSLTQDEIDFLFRAAHGLNAGPAHRPRQLARCDFRQAGQITREQARVLAGLHEAFARNLAHVLGAQLRSHLDVSLVAIEQLGFEEFTQRLPEVCYIASLAVRPSGVSAALQLDLSLAHPMIDLVLGGNGVTEEGQAEVTEIEEQILESIIAVIVRELQLVWQPMLDLRFTFEHRQPMAQILRLMPPLEKVLSLGFELRLPQARGMLNLAFPAVISTGLLRKLSESPVYNRRQEEQQDTGPRIQRRLQGARFELEVVLPASKVPIRRLVALQTGEVVRLAQASGHAAELRIAGRVAGRAQPVRQGRLRAALLTDLPRLAKPEHGS
ncbi:MAG: flagellar motor switch protein FliM [Terriglobales bacterium]